MTDSKTDDKKKDKPSRKMYFTQDTEDAIVRYNNEDDDFERNMIFNKHIKYPLHKLSQNILNTFKFQYFDSTPEDVMAEVVSFIVLNLHKYQKDKGKAYSYFSIVAKNYLILKNNNNYKRYKRTELLSEMEGVWEISDNFYDRERADDISEFVKLMLEYWDDNIYRIFKKDRDIAIAEAILELFRRCENIENFNKKALYLMIREMTGVKTQYITKVINKMKKIQSEMLDNFISDGMSHRENDDITLFWPR